MPNWQDFHWLRIEWFWVLLPIFIALLLAWRYKNHHSQWHSICDEVLLNLFLQQGAKVKDLKPFILLSILAVLSILALAGPSWEKKTTPVYQSHDALVIILNLSASMNADDIKPDRLTRAKQKLNDVLQLRKDGQTALIVYAGDSHIVSPLSFDYKTILANASILSSELMPLSGNQPLLAFQQAEQLFINSGNSQGKILWITDSIGEDLSALDKQIQKISDKFSISILAIASNEGAPIPKTNDQGFVEDKQGNIILSKLEMVKLQRLAQSGKGKLELIQWDDSDIKTLLSRSMNAIDEQLKDSGQNTNVQWQDEGYWLLYLLIPIALLMFRRGWILTIMISMQLVTPVDSYAFDWESLWQDKEKQAYQYYQNKQYEQAATLFDDPTWQANAYYKNGQYQQAVEHYQTIDNIEAKYNLANALAKLGQYQQAIKKYDEVLAQSPEHQDAKSNKALIEKLLEQQKQESSKDKQQSSDKSKDNKSEKPDKSEQNNKDNQQPSEQNNQQSSQNDPENNAENTENSEKNQENSEKNQENSQKEGENQEKIEKSDENTEKNENNDKESVNQGKITEQDDNNESPEHKSAFSQLSDEQKQSMKQYLNQIKDDPAYLLKRKFYLNSLRRQQNQ